ncbi:DUF6265 family protein [Paraflavitalea sp. CAU 1676]|uniref:DUF6265 family protein n=1 Tax=Paraflavitalea sp. CAU 1676 TaxID=3032598 RepID=UPI0023D97B00|nr:DUF6265 family protein [Paraflavitalea sp. CAU 1676]MDF2187173.1 DUF6265 family protein [Paraflavitalea sp. CAU 1676]
MNEHRNSAATLMVITAKLLLTARPALMALLMLCFLDQVQAQQPSAAVPDDFKKLHWLSGTWQRTNAKPGRSGYERWEMDGDRAMKGWGVSMKGNDTLITEKIRLEIKDNKIWYVADVPENKAPVYFELTSITPSGFICENPAHDFPKKISYQLEGNILTAIISAGDKSIPYLFKKQ